MAVFQCSEKAVCYDHVAAPKLAGIPTVGPISPDQDICVAGDGIVRCHP